MASLHVTKYDGYSGRFCQCLCRWAAFVTVVAACPCSLHPTPSSSSPLLSHSLKLPLSSPSISRRRRGPVHILPRLSWLSCRALIIIRVSAVPLGVSRRCCTVLRASLWWWSLSCGMFRFPFTSTRVRPSPLNTPSLHRFAHLALGVCRYRRLYSFF
ncbi:hypothetical protein BC629DRAFT_1532865, partial [Irpex lacteus]